MIDTNVLDGFVLNGLTLNGSFGPAIGSGLIVSIEQSVQVIGSGLIISFEQDVELRASGVGLIVSFEQNTQSSYAGLIISFEQKVESVNTFFDRNGYDIDIYIGGYQVPKNQICGAITIRKEENKSGSFQFTLLPGTGIQDPESYQGKDIYVNLRDETGNYRSFTGFVDTPTIDLIDKKITFDCTDRRDSRILDLAPSFVDLIGVYSDDVFGQPKDQADELDKRLSTVPACVDFDNYGTPKYTPWLPKVTADFTQVSSDIYYDRPNVSYTNRTKTLNTVNFTVKYHFQRLHQQIVNVSWAGYDNFLTDWFNAGTPTFPMKDTIQNAAFSADWGPLGSISYTNLWAAGGFGNVLWQPNQVTHEYKQRVNIIYLPYNPSPGVFSAIWPDGKKYPLETPVLDPNNKPIYDIISTTITDTSSMLCRGASWTAGIKFSQNVVYEFDLSVYSPQAIARFGIIPDNFNVDVNDEYDTSLWERDKKLYYSPTHNFFFDQKSNYSNLVKAIDCSVRKARTSVQGAHRDASINFQRRIWPNIDLIHTVELDTDQVACQGKVSAITHTIDVNTGEGRTAVTLLLSRSNGGDSASSLLVNIPTDDPAYIGSPSNIVLGTHLGLSPDSTVTPGADKWNGYIGNKTIGGGATAPVRTQFSESFIIDYPAIPEALRGDRQLSAGSSFIITIPNDYLEVTF